MDTTLPWKRVRRALFQYTRQHRIPKHRYEQVLKILPRLVALCGHYTQNRRTIFALGVSLLQQSPRLLATVCPAYSHLNGHYTYNGLGDGVPLPLTLHQDFIEKVCELVPNLEVEFLIADHEADFAPLCRSVNLDQREFRERVERSVIASSQAVQSRGWKVNTFTRGVPDYISRLRVLTQELMANPALTDRFTAEMLSRRAFYARLRYPREVWYERTIQIAAQYLALGEYCTRHHIIVCNHTTISLGWLKKTNTALLENPIRIY